jgi:hypothetical protein
LNYVFGKPTSPHSFEVGAGVTYITKKLEIMNFCEDKKTQIFGPLLSCIGANLQMGAFLGVSALRPCLPKAISSLLVQPVSATIFDKSLFDGRLLI